MASPVIVMNTGPEVRVMLNVHVCYTVDADVCPLPIVPVQRQTGRRAQIANITAVC